MRWAALEQPIDLAGTVKVDGRQYWVLGADGEDVLLRTTGAHNEFGEPVQVSEHDLASKYSKVGNTGYYTDKKGRYFIPRDSDGGGIELVQDRNITSMKHAEVAHPKVVERPRTSH
jgi:hypothetical protein